MSSLLEGGILLAKSLQVFDFSIFSCCLGLLFVRLELSERAGFVEIWTVCFKGLYFVEYAAQVNIFVVLDFVGVLPEPFL